MRDSGDDTALLSTRHTDGGFYHPIAIPDTASTGRQSRSRSTVLSLVGPPGSGKTRVGEWIRDAARWLGVAVDVVDTDAFVDQYHLNLARVQTDLYTRPENADKVRRMLNTQVRSDIRTLLDKARDTGGFLVLLGMAHLQEEEDSEESSDSDSGSGDGSLKQRRPQHRSQQQHDASSKRLAPGHSGSSCLPDMYRLCLGVDASLTYVRLAERHLKCIQEQADAIREYLGRLHQNVLQSVHERHERDAVIHAADTGSVYAPATSARLLSSVDATETKEALMVPVLTYGFKIRTPFMTEFEDHKVAQERMTTTWRKAGYSVISPEAVCYAAYHCIIVRAGMGYYAVNPNTGSFPSIGSFVPAFQEIHRTPVDAIAALRCDSAMHRQYSEGGGGGGGDCMSVGIPDNAPYMDTSDLNTQVSLSRLMGLPMVSAYMCLAHLETRQIKAVHKIRDIVVDRRLWNEFHGEH